MLHNSGMGIEKEIKNLEDTIMKKMIFTLTVLLSALTIRAHNNYSDLSIHLHDYSLFTVVLGNKIYSNPSSEQFITDIRPGNHYLKIKKMYYRGHYIQSKTVFSGYINIPSGSSVYSVIDANSRYVVLSCESKNHYSNQHSGNYNNYNNNYYNSAYNYSYFSEIDFLELKSRIGNATFDDTRLSIAKQATSRNNFSSRQVYEITKLFTFESNRLEFAKFAYNHVADPNKYFLVYDAFTFSSSIDELIDYTGNY